MRFADLNGRRVGVWGYGREGRAAVKALRRFASESEVVVAAAKRLTPEERAEVVAAGAKDRSDEGVVEALAGCDVVVRSPGVSIYLPEMAAVRSSGATITTGTNIWFAEHQAATVIAVTGTKGKSTTTALIGHLLKGQGRDTVVAGNIGTPLLDVFAPEQEPDVWVFELSSHQTADLNYSPTVGVVLNLSREHLDWHLSDERYFEDKLNLLRHGDDMVAVLNHESQELVNRNSEFSDIRWFGDGGRFHVSDGDIYDQERVLYRSADISLRGRHNRMNVCAALTAITEVGADPSQCNRALQTFQPLPHRLQEIFQGNGIAYIDDSISTTPEATLAALEALGEQPVTLLLGGFDREQQYESLIQDVLHRRNVVAVIAMPDNGKRIYSDFEAALEREQSSSLVLENAENISDAVARAKEVTPPGGAVLLSPAAPSYGRFENFEERGAAFAQHAKQDS